MMFDCAGIYKDIVHVDCHIVLIDEVPENVIHQHLEGGWAVGEAEEYEKGFEEAPIHLEGGLPLVSLLDSYIVVSPAYIQLHEVLCLGVCRPFSHLDALLKGLAENAWMLRSVTLTPILLT